MWVCDVIVNNETDSQTLYLKARKLRTPQTLNFTLSLGYSASLIPETVNPSPKNSKPQVNLSLNPEIQTWALVKDL